MQKLTIEIFLGNKENMDEEGFGQVAVATALSNYVAKILAGGDLEVDGVAPGCGCQVITTHLTEDGIPHICLAERAPEELAH